MKNKKILSRVLALSATLILVVALAVPCFADTPVNVPDGALDAFYNNWGASDMIDINLREIYGYDIFDYSAISLTTLLPNGTYSISSAPVGSISADFYVKKLSSGEVYTLSNSQIATWYDEGGSQDITLYFGSANDNKFVLNYYKDYNTNSYMLTSATWMGTIYHGTDIPDFVIFVGFRNSPAFMNDLSVLLGGTQDSVAYPAEFLQGYTSNTGSGSAPIEPTRSGMFGQLYYTLRDAIFGEDVVLDGTQDFTLTQMATWLTYAVALLPAIICVCFCFKCFRW